MLIRAVFLSALLALPLHAQEAEPSMTLERLNEIVKVLDPDAQSNGRMWHFQIADVPILIVTDPASDRMRAMAAIREAEGLESEELHRMMQANFDSALDARYAIANDTLWSTYIHPLAALEKDQLISALGQVVNLTTSYGTLYSGGGLQFGGGDSNDLHRQLIEDLLKKGEEL